jgi:hypothetical protein
VRISGREFSQQDIVGIQRRIEKNPDLSRRGLSRQVCEDLGWRAVNGKLKEMSCRVALLKLEGKGLIRLKPVAPFKAKRKPRAVRTEVEVKPIRCRLEKLSRLN